MNETNAVRGFLIHASKLGARLWRQNTGHGWIGEATKFTRTQTITVNSGDVVIRKARPFHAGFEGLADIGGISQTGRYVAVEAKTATGRVSDEQRAFIRMVRSFGGLAGVARSDADVEAILRGEIRD